MRTADQAARADKSAVCARGGRPRGSPLHIGVEGRLEGGWEGWGDKAAVGAMNRPYGWFVERLYPVAYKRMVTVGDVI
jgi:hypothetical protein